MTLKNSYLEILVFIAYLSISMLFFSTILYQIEYNDGPDTWVGFLSTYQTFSNPSTLLV